MAPPDASADAVARLQPGRFELWALALGTLGALAWAALAPLDEGVPAQGMVAIDTKSKPVQHLAGGLIQEVLVKEGQMVREGQVLLRLDDAAVRANFESARQRYLGLRAMQDRLQAEQDDNSRIVWHPDLQQAAADAQISQMMLIQTQLLAARRASLQADLRALQEGVAGQEQLIRAQTEMLEQKREQLALLQNELGQTRALVQEGYVPRNRQLELERNAAELRSAMADLVGSTGRASRSIAELRERAIARRQEHRKEVQTLSADVGREVPADEQRLRAAQEELARVTIRSPATGQVVGLSSQAVGGVVAPGQKLMDIVPGTPDLLLEVRVPPHLIDRVHAGLPVDVRFASFANTPQLVVTGRVSSVSADLLTDARTAVSYYLARVSPTSEGLKQLGQRQLQPGMPVEVVFITGERSLLTYLLHPLSKRLASALNEE
jgi:protease secretion system membrane fusion protein